MGDLEFKWTNLEKVLEEYGRELRNKYQDSLINNDRIASGELLNSCEYIIQKDSYSISVSLQLAEYWKYVEWDTKPHWPPVDKIKEWIRVKPILPDNRFGKLPTPDQLAFLIGRKIAGESPNKLEGGTKGSNDLHQSIEELNNEYMQLIKEAITKDVDEASTVILTEYFSTI